MASAKLTARWSRGSRHVCAGCHQRKARFRYRGMVKADRHHTLCFECFRAAANRLRSRVEPRSAGVNSDVPRSSLVIAESP
jgi:hypothetical protein